MKKIVFSLLLSTFLLSSLQAAEHEVKMLNAGKDGAIMVFEPAALKVAVGDTVKFVPTDMGHDVASHLSPEGGVTWKGELGKEVSVTIDKEGLYIYKCQPHIALGMVGVIQAGEATNKEAVLKSAKELASKFAMNKDRLDKYISALGTEKNDTTTSKTKDIIDATKEKKDNEVKEASEVK